MVRMILLMRMKMNHDILAIYLAIQRLTTVSAVDAAYMLR